MRLLQIFARKGSASLGGGAHIRRVGENRITTVQLIDFEIVLSVGRGRIDNQRPHLMGAYKEFTCLKCIDYEKHFLEHYVSQKA